MKNDLVAGILRATASLRSGDPAAVTAIVQNALAAAGLAGPANDDGHADDTRVGTPMPAPETRQGAASLASLPGRLRKPLSEVVSALRAGRRGLIPNGMAPGLGRSAPIPDVPLPDGAQFLDLCYSCAAGTRRYRLYVPSTARDGLEGLIVMLHGCTQSPEDFASGTGMNDLAEVHRLLIAYPAQTSGENSMSCWNWFRPGDQTRGAGEPAILAGLATSLRDQYAIPAGRVFVAGLSAGGAMAAIMGETYPDLFEAIGVHSGLAHGSANDVVSAFAAMRGQAGTAPQRPARHRSADPGRAPRVIVIHGGADTTVHPSNAERIIARHADTLGNATRTDHGSSDGNRPYTRLVARRDDGRHAMECWLIDGAPHAWAGGHPSGSYTDPDGPNASAAMVGFFLGGAVSPV